MGVAPNMVFDRREGRHVLISVTSLMAVASVNPQSTSVRIGPSEKVDDGAYHKRDGDNATDSALPHKDLLLCWVEACDLALRQKR